MSVEPMLAASVETLPEGADLVYEPKWDGFRCLATTGPAVAMTTKSGRRVDALWPEIADALRALPQGLTLDGELVRWHEGRLDFGALVRRNAMSPPSARADARAHPCHLVLFDLIAAGGAAYARRELAYRRHRLEAVMDTVAQPSPLSLGWQTPDAEEARAWMEGLASVGIEGVVIKSLHSSYMPGRRGWRKLRTRTTTEAIVGALVGRALVLGRYDAEGVLRIAGRTGRLSGAQWREVAPHLEEADGCAHPWPPQIRDMWGRGPVPIERVCPTLVVEIEPDTAISGRRWRHLVPFVRPRPDVRSEDVPRGLDVDAG